MGLNEASRSEPQLGYLSVRLDPGAVSVSYLSSLLRVLQAALREVARDNEQTRRHFDSKPQPVLMVGGVRAGNGLTVDLTFADPLDSSPLEALSSHTFHAFLDNLGEYVRKLPQPRLWGGAARRPPPRELETDLARRMDQVYVELRRVPKVTVRYQGRAIEVEGDRMEIV
jgi:hypothetical protein